MSLLLGWEFPLQLRFLANVAVVVDERKPRRKQAFQSTAAEVGLAESKDALLGQL